MRAIATLNNDRDMVGDDNADGLYESVRAERKKQDAAEVANTCNCITHTQIDK